MLDYGIRDMPIYALFLSVFHNSSVGQQMWGRILETVTVP